MNLESSELERLKEILMPFLKTAKGIPDNWPQQCSLRYDVYYRDGEEVNPHISYYKAGLDAGPTIGDYRKLEEWCKEYKVEGWSC